jgi:DNA polymerase III subunit epsilon
MTDNTTDNISSLTFVAFDTETTGMYPASDALVEVAAVRFNLVDGPLEYFQSLVNPERPIPPFVSNIHGIRDEMVKDSPTIAQVMPRFLRFIEGAVPVAHHAPFDLGFISLHALRLGHDLPKGPVMDSCTFARRAFPEQPTHKLEALVKAFGIAESTFHRALADAKSCMEVFRLAAQKSCGHEAKWDDFLKAHGRTFAFGDGNAPRPIGDKDLAPKLVPIIEALQNKKPIWMEYEGSYGPRQVSPLMLYAKGAQQYLEATCHLDGMRKSFRLDRIKGIIQDAR